MIAQTEALTTRSKDEAETIARRFLQQGVFQLEQAEVDALQIAQQDRTAHNGVTHVTLQQQVNGIEVFGARMSVHVTRAGEVFAANGELIPQAARAAKLARPRLAANTALEFAAASTTQISRRRPMVEPGACKCFCGMDHRNSTAVWIKQSSCTS